MKSIYLVCTVAGFITPNIFVLGESIDTGNILLWLNPTATINGMFANRIATAFVVDLLFGVLVFFLWSYDEAKRTGIKNVWVIWILTMLFGLAGTFPLFLYLRERKLLK